MYDAARAIERHSIDEVLAGIPVLVRSAMNPGKFSFFLLNDDRQLKAEVTEGWTEADSFERVFHAGSSVFRAVMRERRMLVASDPEHEAILQGQGLLAGTLFSEETGESFGMLKIEGVAFQDFTPAYVQNFRILCEWIGAAVAKAQRVERLLSLKPASPVQMD
jgi:GAF domain-containing protein